MMKKKWMIAIVSAVTVLSLTVFVWAGTADPGSEGDPVVTKSYVDGKINELKSSMGTSVSGTTGSAVSYKSIQLNAGQKLIGGEGAELILRSGEAAAIDNGANGVSDMTAGKDLRTGEPVLANHLLLVPRADGRGIVANTIIWVMVRGTYTIQ